MVSLSAQEMAEARVEDEEERMREAREAGGARRNARAPNAAPGEVLVFHLYNIRVQVRACVREQLSKLKWNKIIHCRSIKNNTNITNGNLYSFAINLTR